MGSVAVPMTCFIDGNRALHISKKLSHMPCRTLSTPQRLYLTMPARPRRALSQMPRMQAQDLVKQMKEMTAAQKRWEAQVREGKVKALTPKEAGYAIQLSDKILLDVRPSIERKKAWVKGSTWIPIFEVDKKLDLDTILKKVSNFVMGGWWSGTPLLVYNDQFLNNVQEKFTKDANIIVACQKGLRSLAACEQLYNAGYRNLFWIQGGLDAAEEGDLERDGPQPFKFASIAGMSEYLGWTDQQRAAAAKEGWGYRAIFFGRLSPWFMDVGGSCFASRCSLYRGSTAWSYYSRNEALMSLSC